MVARFLRIPIPYIRQKWKMRQINATISNSIIPVSNLGLKLYDLYPYFLVIILNVGGAMHFIYYINRLTATKVDSTYLGCLTSNTQRICLWQGSNA